MHPMRRRIVLGATGVALLGAAGGAYAATRPSQDRDAVLADAAERLHVTPKALSDALQGAASDQLDAAVKAGRLTREQADAIERRAQGTNGVPYLGGGDHGFGPGDHHGAGVRGGLDEAAAYLGLTPAELRGRLAAGKSLADVAKDRGKDIAGLQRVLEQAARTRIQQAVKDGRITRAEAGARLQDLASEVEELVQRGGLDGPGFGAGHHGFGPGGPGPGPGRGALGEGLQAAAGYLGITPAELGSQLAAGKSLADVAKAQGKTADGLAQRLVAAARARLDAAVKAKRLTQAEADRISTDLRADIDEEIQATGFGRRHRAP
jgi:AraC-like DNA-binding protein